MDGHPNGHTNGTKLVNGASSSYDDQQAVNEIRKFVIDICRQNGGGHGGSGKLHSTLVRYDLSKSSELESISDLDSALLQLSISLEIKRNAINSM